MIHTILSADKTYQEKVNNIKKDTELDITKNKFYKVG